jgi:uncharacterized SAM-binding protein YcdF (DUF218 family)
MFLFLSKLLPLLFYPLGLTIVLTIAGLVLIKRRRRRLASLLGIIAVWILYWSSTDLVAQGLTQSLEFQNLPASIPSADAIVILGGATKSATSPRVLPEVGEAGDRVIYGAKLYKDGKAPKIILSGGRIPWGGDIGSESSDMAILLDLFGVPRDAILEDPASLNTIENAKNVKQLIERENIRSMLLVTSGTHMPRSLAIFRKLGMEVSPAPTDFQSTNVPQAVQGRGQLLKLLPDAENLMLTTRALKEWVGLVVYRLRGWA